MQRHLFEKAVRLMNTKEFIYLATCNLDNEPHASSKFFIKTEGAFVYLADFALSRIYENLRQNPRVSLAVMDHDTLHGYRLNGKAFVMDINQEYEQVAKELQKRKINYTTDRIIRAVQTGVTHQDFELSFPDHFLIFKIEIETVVEINPQGKIHKEKLKAQKV